MTNSKYDVMNDVKKTKSDDFLTNLSKEKERQNNAIGVSSGSSSSKTNSGNYYVFSADGNTKSEPKTSKVQEPLIYYNQKPEHVIEREKNYVTNRYNVEKQNPSDETKVLQTNLNSYGYVGKDNKPLNVDSAYGENTNYAFNNAWRNNEQVIKNREIVQKRDIIEPMLNAIYEPMKEKANSRKHNASKDEITQIQNMLINEGHTDWNGNPLNVTGEFDEKTLGGYEKYIQETTPKQEVYNMQKELNALEITDVYGNAIKQDGLLGPITDGTVQNFIHQANNITSEELEPVRGDTEKTKADYSQLRKNFAYYNALAEPYNTSVKNNTTKPTMSESVGYKLDETPFNGENYNKFALLNSDSDFQKVYEDSVKNNVEIKNKPVLEKFDIPYQYKVTDEEVLDEFDMMKIKALKGLYNWAIENGDRLTADKAHKAAVDIRNNTKYNGKGYGENYIDNYIYSDEFDKDAELYSLIETPLDEMRVKQLHSNAVDDLIDSGGLSLVLQYLASRGIIIPAASNYADIISQLFSGFGDGIDKYAPTVHVGDVPITIEGQSYYYRPSDGSIILG